LDTSQIFTVFGIEAWLGALALTLIVVDLVTGRGRLTGPADMVRLVAMGGLAALLVYSFSVSPAEQTSSWGTLDTFALFFKRFFLASGLLTLLLSAPYETRLTGGRGEFPTLVIFTTMGMCLLASVSDFVTLFVGLELVTITLFLLAAYRPGLPRSIEAGIKFVIIGAIAASFLVYGIAFVYGATGHLDFEGVRAALAASESVPAGLTFGLLLVIVGLGFKLGAVPFHVWIPDVYQGAPTPVTAFLSVGSKAAGVVLLMRVVFTVLSPVAAQWATLLAGLAALSLLMGNLGAIPQTDMKRFLGYSGIAHAGFLLLAMAAHTEDSASAILFYMVAYLFANVAAFLVVIVVSRTPDNAHMDRLNGLAERSPFLALALTVSMLSLAGVPPFAGFVGKFLILRAAVADPSLLPVVILGLVMIVVSLYYYLCILKRMYFREPVDTGVLEITGSTRLLLLVCVVVTAVLGIYFNPLVVAAESGAAALFG
jgi:NADH-quinone oxidoreductase subunit N